MRKFLVFVAGCILMAGSSIAADEVDQPHAIIERTATELAQQLKDREDYFGNNLPELYKLIDDLLLPVFDMNYAGKQVLGREHWTKANAEQRQRFIDTFYSFLVRTYARGLLGFNQDDLRINPNPAYTEKKDKALVNTNIKLPDGTDVQVNYALLQTRGTWKLYDVRIGGASYIKNYRNQFDAEISAKGIEYVINRLEKEAAAAEKEG